MIYIAKTKDFRIAEPTALSIGKFDGLHRGHKKLVKELLSWKEKGYKTAVFTFSTPPASLVKGKPQTMIMTNEERGELLSQAGIDYLVEYPFDEEVCHMEPERFISEVLAGRMHAGVIATGPDCHYGYKAAGDRALLETMAEVYGYRYFVVDKERDPENNRIISSTYIRELLAEGEMQRANRLLGYHYFVSGPVVHGTSIGHTKLYPTANVVPGPEKHLPKFGVYVTRVTVAGETYVGLTNVGKKPTISGENPTGVETYLYHFDGNIYGKTMRMEFLDFVRPEMKFESLEELKRQLDHDIEVCRARYYEFV